MPEKELTDCVELPAIIKGGVVIVENANLVKLDETELRRMADVMNGELAYIKYDVIYTQTNPRLCGHKECWRPVGLKNPLKCTDHE